MARYAIHVILYVRSDEQPDEVERRVLQDLVDKYAGTDTSIVIESDSTKQIGE